MAKMKNISGKHVVLFETSLFYPGQMLDIMKTEVEARGGNVINQHNFKAFFRIKLIEQIQYGNKISDFARILLTAPQSK